jgi:hypothetical protein
MNLNEPQPVEIEFGTNYPKPEQLRTGDILYVRPAVPTSHWRLLMLPDQLLEVDRQKTVAEFLGPSLMLQLAVITNDADVLADAQDLARRAELEFDGLRKTTTLPMKEMLFLIALMYVEFPVLVKSWFHISITRFLMNPLVKLLMKSFDGSIKDGFFIGHCAMVIRETDGAEDGAGTPYIIEANATSFDHYGVNITPYYLPDDGRTGTGLYRSWAQARAARGDACWLARPTALADDASPIVRQRRQSLLAGSKTYLGRNYSFFDNPEVGDAGRLYCSEFIYRAFGDVSKSDPAVPPMNDGGVMTWQWMKDNNPDDPQKPDGIGHWVQKCWDDPDIGPHIRKKGALFFILTVQMLWHTTAVDNTVFRPYGQPYQ